MKTFLRLILALGVLGAGASQADPIVRMKFVNQTQSNWCWAATATSTINHMRRLKNDPDDVSQCRIVTHYNNVNSDYSFCCKSANASGTKCNQPGSVYGPLNRHGYLKEQITGQLTDDRFDLVISQLKKNLPTPAAVRWVGQNVGHAILVYGLGFPGIAGGQDIYIYDPITGRTGAMQNKNALDKYGTNANGSWKAMYVLKR